MISIRLYPFDEENELIPVKLDAINEKYSKYPKESYIDVFPGGFLYYLSAGGSIGIDVENLQIRVEYIDADAEKDLVQPYVQRLSLIEKKFEIDICGVEIKDSVKRPLIP
ncbi:MAG: hypothetical protein FWG96_02540 [Methanomassiliicoccaceae archaeon]|nr:hypothetical protein [Methanomassiliicoccaceae archaeon]